jgi:hypothetical protein
MKQSFEAIIMMNRLKTVSAQFAASLFVLGGLLTVPSLQGAEGPGAGEIDPFELPSLETPLLLADAQAAAPESAKAQSAECLAFAKDIDADLGEVLKAGCQPTLAQMSALMDNPLGNVAMLFTQFDLYKMENPSNEHAARPGQDRRLCSRPRLRFHSRRWFPAAT